MKAKCLILFLSALVFAGCSSSSWMTRDFDKSNENYEEIPTYLITLGMTKQELVNALGKPSKINGATTKYDLPVDVWEYNRWKSDIGEDYVVERYYVYFIDGKLAQWGRPGEWNKSPDLIIDIN